MVKLPKTICGTDIDEKGFLITISNKVDELVKPVVVIFKDKELYFCEESCKEDFLNSQEKEQWIKNHQ
ncbi:MAG: hypothetical protein ACXAC5_14180 [Promethearchaeota archaeon]|jgi:hypothetical protein